MHPVHKRRASHLVSNGLRWVALCSTAVSLLAPAAVCAQEADDAILPYRPTVSNPAQLPAPGQVEVELGGLRSRGHETSRDSLPYLLKLAFTQEWGVLIGGDAHVRARDEDGQAQGVGDTSVILKRAWLVDTSTAFGIELGAKLPTAKDGLGSGRSDYSLNTLFSRDWGLLHLDVNVNATRLGAFEPGTVRTQLGGAVALSAALTEKWGLAVEASGTHRTRAAHGDQLLGAVTYSPTKRLTFDVGVVRAPRPSPATTQWFAGVVFPLAKLW